MLSSLRTQLIALTIVIQIVTVAALVWNSMRLTETHLARLLEQRRAAPRPACCWKRRLRRPWCNATTPQPAKP